MNADPLLCTEHYDLRRVESLLRDFPSSSFEHARLLEIKNQCDAQGRLKVEFRPFVGAEAGRLHSKIGALQLSPRVRAFVLSPEYAVYDMVSAFPRLLQAEFKQKGVECKALDEYCENRQEITKTIIAGFHEHLTADKVKRAFIIAMHFGKDRFLTHVVEAPQLARFATEVQAGVRELFSKAEYLEFVGEDTEGVCVSRLLEIRERQVITLARHLASRHAEVGSPLFDGFLAAGLSGAARARVESQVSKTLGCVVRFRRVLEPPLDVAVLPVLPAGKTLVLLMSDVVNMLPKAKDQTPNEKKALQALRESGSGLALGTAVSSTVPRSSNVSLRFERRLGQAPFVELEGRFWQRTPEDYIPKLDAGHFYPNCVVLTAPFGVRHIIKQPGTSVLCVSIETLIPTLTKLRKQHPVAPVPVPADAAEVRRMFLLPDRRFAYDHRNDVLP